MTCDDGQVQTITNDVDKCNKFVDYFSKVYTCESDDDFKSLEIAAPTSVLPDIFIEEDDIINRLNKLKIDKSPGPDLLHPRILKELSVEIASALKYLFTLSLATGELPFDWKSSFIMYSVT